MKHALRASATAFIVAIAFAASVAAGPYEDGVAAYQQGDYASAVRLWHPVADQGFPAAQNRIGIAYATGRGVPQDYAAALDWYRKAADQGYAAAQNNLGSAYAAGRGVPQDYAAAVDWFLKAAKQGYAAAQNNLGSAYAGGHVLPQDYAAAVELVSQGGGTGLRRGSKQSRVRVRGRPGRAAGLCGGGGLVSQGGRPGRRRCSKQPRRHVRGRPGRAAGLCGGGGWYRKAADQGYAAAQNNLGVMYADGLGVPRDHAVALSWYRKAADQGYAAAQNNLGLAYTNGYGAARDYVAALNWYRKAADQGYAAVQYNLASSYATGRGVSQDYDTAYKWFNLAAKAGNADAARERDKIVTGSRLKMVKVIVIAIAPAVLVLLLFATWDTVVARFQSRQHAMRLQIKCETTLNHARIGLKQLHDSPAALAVVALSAPVITFLVADNFSPQSGVLGSIPKMYISVGFAEVSYRWVVIVSLVFLTYATVPLLTRAPDYATLHRPIEMEGKSERRTTTTVQSSPQTASSPNTIKVKLLQASFTVLSIVIAGGSVFTASDYQTKIDLEYFPIATILGATTPAVLFGSANLSYVWLCCAPNCSPLLGLRQVNAIALPAAADHQHRHRDVGGDVSCRGGPAIIRWAQLSRTAPLLPFRPQQPRCRWSASDHARQAIRRRWGRPASCSHRRSGQSSRSFVLMQIGKVLRFLSGGEGRWHAVPQQRAVRTAIGDPCALLVPLHVGTTKVRVLCVEGIVNAHPLWRIAFVVSSKHWNGFVRRVYDGDLLVIDSINPFYPIPITVLPHIPDAEDAILVNNDEVLVAAWFKHKHGPLP